MFVLIGLMLHFGVFSAPQYSDATLVIGENWRGQTLEVTNYWEKTYIPYRIWESDLLTTAKPGAIFMVWFYIFLLPLGLTVVSGADEIDRYLKQASWMQKLKAIGLIPDPDKDNTANKVSLFITFLLFVYLILFFLCRWIFDWKVYSESDFFNFPVLLLSFFAAGILTWWNSRCVSKRDREYEKMMKQVDSQSLGDDEEE
tara:strand:+ start:66 stop:665 length:600 start_codon:yes stop_codon:yes gene_type:complete